ncbi:unnamed protein product [Sphagnum tenellum]
MTRRGEEEDEEKISDIADFLRREKPRSLDRTGFCIPGASREDGLQAAERASMHFPGKAPSSPLAIVRKYS